MKLFMFAASLQKHSLNRQLIQLTASLAKQAGHVIDYVEFNQFNLPLYNADRQSNEGFPTAVADFISHLQQAEGTIIATPEYNHSIPGTLKNLIDWVSRVTPNPWENQVIQLLSASPSLVGGNRGLWQTRIPLESCGALVLPEMFSLASAQEAFDNNGDLIKQDAHQRLQQILINFLTLLNKIKRSD